LGDVQLVKAALSKLHSKVELAMEEAKAKVAEVLVVGLHGHIW
jgi:hypothetical protein